MPVTPFHFGPGLVIGLPLRNYLDVPVFVLASVVIDLEPISVWLLRLDLPLHGYCHNIFIGTFVALAWAWTAWRGRRLLTGLMRFFGLAYKPAPFKITVAALAGVWFHVLLDAPLYADVRPFFPFTGSNPFYGTVSLTQMYAVCALLFIPALLMYGGILLSASTRRDRRRTAARPE